MALCTGLNNLNQRKSPGLDITEMVVIRRPLQEILGKIQQVNKHTRNHRKFRSREAKEDMMTQQRTQRQSAKHERLNPAKNALSQGTLEKKSETESPESHKNSLGHSCTQKKLADRQCTRHHELPAKPHR